MKAGVKKLLDALLALVSLGLSRRKSSVDAQHLVLANSQEAIKILMDDIVRPLRHELRETREKLSDVETQLDKALDAFKLINDCKYAQDCPLRHHSVKDSPME